MNKIQKSKEILKIAIPSGLSSFLDILNLSLALFFLSKLSTSHIVAFGASMNFIMLFYTITAIFFTGTNALISRLYGQKSPKIQIALFSSLSSALLFSLSLLGIAFFSYTPYLSWIGLSNASLNLANIYLGILIFQIPALLLKTTLTSAFSAITQAKIPFYIKIFSTFLNIALCYFLIFGITLFPALDILGAGLANLISLYIELFLLLASAFKRFGSYGGFDFSFVKKVIALGIPTGIERTFTLFSFVLISKFLLSYGDELLAGFQIGGRIEAFVFMPGFGFMVASMTLMGQKQTTLDLQNITLRFAYGSLLSLWAYLGF